MALAALRLKRRRGAARRLAHSFAALAALALAGVATAQVAGPVPAASPGLACLVDGRVDEVLATDSAVFLAGSFTHARPPVSEVGGAGEVVRRYFAACDAATGAVLAWDPEADCDGCSNPGGKALALSDDGAWIYLGGRFGTIAGATAPHLVRVGAASAARDAGFVPAPSDRLHELLLAGSRLYVGGNFTTIAGDGQPHLAALDPVSGARDESFAPGVDAAGFATVYALALAAGGDTLYVGGQFESLNGLARSSAGAVDAATGTVTRDFAPQLADENPADEFVQIYEIQLDGDLVYLCGDWWSTEGVGSKPDQRNVNRFAAASGAADPTFWVGTDGGVQACALELSLDALVVGGHFDCVVPHIGGVPQPGGAPCGGDGTVGVVQRDLFAMRLADGALLDWNPDTGGVGGTWALALRSGRLWAGGELHLPRTAPVDERTHVGVIPFAVPLLNDGFERGLARWSD